MIFERLSGVDQFTELSRLAIWAGAGLIFIGHPIAGIGYGNFKNVLAATVAVPEGFMLDAHNLYMELLAETGSAADLLLFVILAFTVIRRGVKYVSRTHGLSWTRLSASLWPPA